MLFADSRYARGTPQFLADSSGQRRKVVPPPSYYPMRFASRQHVVREGDRLERLSFQYYGDPDRWWVIAAANSEVFYPEDLTPGSVIRIPDASTIR